MGTFQSDYLIIEIWDIEGKVEAAADNFLQEIPEEYKKLFHKFNKLTNGLLVYFMTYDGSKEGWKTSDDADELRSNFIDLIKKTTSGAEIFHIKPRGELQEEDTIYRYRDANVGVSE